MRWCLFLLCSCVVLASVQSDLQRLVTAPNFIFWAQRGEQLIRFFQDINLVKQRLRQSFGKSFASSPFAIDLPQLTSAVNNLIDKLNSREINEMIVEGNPAIIMFFLGKRFNAYTSFEFLSFPPDLPNVHLIPIEELQAENLASIPIDTLVRITLARIRTGLVNNRWVLFENLPSLFWTHQSVRFNTEVLNFYSPLCLYNVNSYETISRSSNTVVSSNCFQIYQEPVASYWNSFAALDLTALFDKYQASRDPMMRVKLANDIVLIIFHLQAAVHVMIMDGQFYLPLFKIITESLGAIRVRAKAMLAMLPSDVNIRSVLHANQTCFSSLIFHTMKDTNSPYQSWLSKDLFPESCVLGDLSAVKKVLGLPAGSLTFQSLSAAQKDVLFWPIFMQLCPSCRVSGELTLYIESLAAAVDGSHIDISELNLELGQVRNFCYLIKTCTQAALPIILSVLSKQEIYAFKDLYSLVVPFIRENHPKVSFNLLVRPFFLNSSPYEEAPLKLHHSEDFEKLKPIFSERAADILKRYRLPEPKNIKALPDSVILPGYKYLDVRELAPSDSSNYLIRIILKNSIVNYNHTASEFKFFDYALQEYYKSTNWPQGIQGNEKGRSFDGLRKTFDVYPPFFKPLTKYSDDTPISETESMSMNMLKEQNPRETGQQLNIPQEVGFIQEVCDGLARMAKNPSASWQILFSDSINLSGVGPLVDTLNAFGKVISMPELRTVVYVESHRGFVPAPFLDPKVMAFLGLWVAACLRTKVTLPIQFSPLYLRFLLYDWPNNSEESFDALVNEIYAPVFEFINKAFELMAVDKFADGNMPLEFRPHRMFSIPEPYPAGPSPFILDPVALEKNQATFSSRSNREKLLAMSPTLYSALARRKMKQALLQGRLEFQRHFRLFFSDEFTTNSSHLFLSKFFTSEPVNVEQLIDNFEVDCEASLVIRNDLPSARSSTISPKDLIISSVRGFDRKEIDQLLWFARGSSNLPLGGFDKPLKFLVTPGTKLAKAQTCFSIVLWEVNVNSAKASIKSLKVAMNFSSGFVENE